MKTSDKSAVLLISFCSMIAAIHCYADNSIDKESESFGRIVIDCNNPKPEDASICARTNLVRSDQDLNSAYKWLVGNLAPAEVLKLKSDQNAWIRERNNVCKLSSNDTRDKNWLSKIFKSPTKSKCVMRYSNARVIELNSMIEKQKSIISIARHPPQDYIHYSEVTHEHGLWYFEVLVNAGEIAQATPVDVTSSCRPSNPNDYLPSVGFHTTYKPTVNVTGENLIGLAIDLNKGKLYSSMNGIWQHGKPGSSDGLDILLGRPWGCGIQTNETVEDLLKRKFIEVNFGERPFTYELPAGYKPFRGDPIWLFAAADDKGTRLSFDYLSFNTKSDKPSVTARQEHVGLLSLKEISKQFKSMQFGLEIDCKTKKAINRDGYFVSEKNTYVGTSAYENKVDQRVGLDTVGGRLIESLCFIKENNFDLPDIGVDDQWEPMLSPMPFLVKINEATNRRQYRNGYLLVKQKNETAIAVNDLGEPSKLLVGISAFNCADHSMHALLRVRYGEHGNVLGGEYYDNENSPPKLSQNMARFETACALMATDNHSK